MLGAAMVGMPASAQAQTVIIINGNQPFTHRTRIRASTLSMTTRVITAIGDGDGEFGGHVG
jgi:hypothetical protein